MLFRERNAFIGAGVGVALLVVTWVLAFHVGPFISADHAIFNGFYDLHHHGMIPRIAKHVAGLCDPEPYFFLAALPVAVAVARKRWRLAVTIGVILFAAPFTTELLKPLLAAPRPNPAYGAANPVGSVSWPSGHATAAMSLALTSVLAAPARLRPAAAALGAAFAVAVSYSFLTLGWHYPSDVLGGFLVAATWTLLGVGALLASNRGRRRQMLDEVAPEPVTLQAALAPIGATLAAAATLACLILLVRPHAVVDYASAHKLFVAGAAAIAALGMTLAAGVMFAVSGSGRAPTAARRHRWRPGSG